MKRIPFLALMGLAALGGLHTRANAQLVINEKLTGATSSYNWTSLNGACLTAGSNAAGTTIPACIGLPYYNGKIQVGGTSGRLPDAVGSGALRLTNGDVANGGSNGDNQTGAVVSNFTFPTNQGLQLTFTTVTYGGDGNNGTGADGISFFLSDGAQPVSVGALGGSLGYSCSNVNGTYDGVVGGYVGIGIDEYGNFANRVDNTSSGLGIGLAPGRISVRGAGSTAWSWLNARYPNYYPSTLTASQQRTAVQTTCRDGVLWNYSGNTVLGTAANSPTLTPLASNYPFLATAQLPGTVTIANQEGIAMPLRGNATPITYSLQITPTGLLNLSYSVSGGTAQPVITGQDITANNGPLPGSFRFGFSAGTGGSSNVHEVTCFKAAPSNLAGNSAGVNAQQSSKVQAGSQVYLAYYHPTNWWGQLTAQDLVYTAATDTVSINPVASWDASCVLTGGACAAMQSGGVTPNVTAQGSTSRKILTWTGTTGGTAFQWSNLTSAQQASLTSSARLDYLRGVRTGEQSNSGGTFRNRTGVLGDIVDSSPTWVGPPSSPYKGPWVDALYSAAVMPEASGQSYTTFSSTNATRQNVVYVGANDGMLHGFRAGSYDASGNFVANSTTPNDGLEAIAYVPATVLSTIRSSTTPALDFSGPFYSHNFYVDATPGNGDLYYAGAWHTWLVGGLGAGGNAGGAIGDNTSTAVGAIYALDITTPANFSESSSLVLGEWASTGTYAITCVNATACGANLGSGVGTPQIRRLHNGKWAVLFGNGLNSANGKAGLFIMLVDPTSGARTFRYLDTGMGPSSDPLGNNSKNGIAYVTPADLDGDHITDYVYAGDAFGNIWRFDLTSSSETSWAAPTAPMFTTTRTTVAGPPVVKYSQPVTTRLTVSAVPSTGTSQPRVIVSFGTGQQLPQTLTTPTSYAAGPQALYGLWDWNLSAWNTSAGATARYASLTAPQTVSVTSLQSQSVTATTVGTGSVASYRTVSNSVVCWKGSTDCGSNASSNTKFGWALTLPSSSEQVIYSPTTSAGMFIVNTTIPAVTQALSCDTQAASGYTMGVTLQGGGASTQSFFADANNNFATAGGSIISGIGLSATGSPSIVTANGKPYLVQQTVTGTGTVNQVNPGANAMGGRLNWLKLR